MARQIEVPQRGSYSTATLKADDIMQAIESLLPEEIVNDFWQEFHEGNYEQADMILFEDAFDFINARCPEGTYFGAHPGDGADFGVWEYEDDDEVYDDEGKGVR